MKKVIAILLAVWMCLSLLVACGGSEGGSEEKSSSPQKSSGAVSESGASGNTSEESNVVTSENGENSESQESSASPASSPASAETSSKAPSEEEPMPVVNYGYGVYTIVSAETGEKVILNNKNELITGAGASGEDGRFTLHYKIRTNKQGEKVACYAIYVGDNEVNAWEISSTLPKYATVKPSGNGYQPSDKAVWYIEDNEDGTCRIRPYKSVEQFPMSLAIVDGKVVAADYDETATNQLFKIEKAPASSKYLEFVSDKGEVVLRIGTTFISRSSGITAEMMQDYVNFMQEAVEAEVELTGYRPYDIFVISGWEDLGYVAGVSDNYNFINASKGFMLEEMSKLAYRRKNLKIMDLSFGMLHELGHMFDSGRGWNFESEAWTDLKLCYVLYKMTKDHAETDGYVFGAAAADFGRTICYTYETMADGVEGQNGLGGLNNHADKGAMETVYGFFGAARLFLLMTYDFGWEPFIQTFHWYQDNGYVQNSFTRWERFTTFVDKLSEYSGKDIKNDYLNENNWHIFEEYYNNRTTEVV